MKYSIVDTVLIFNLDFSILKLTREFAESHLLHLYVADRESDLIAVPNLFIVTDINKLTNETFDYIRGSDSEGIFVDELIISITEPKTELAIAHSKYFEIKTDLSVEYLNEILPRRMLIRSKSELREAE